MAIHLFRVLEETAPFGNSLVKNKWRKKMEEIKKLYYIAGKQCGIKNEAYAIHKIVKSKSNIHLIDSLSDDRHNECWNHIGEYNLQRKNVQEHIINILDKCDKIIAIIDTPDAFGTIAELGYVSGRGGEGIVFVLDRAAIPIGTPISDAYWFTPIVTPISDAYWLISNFPGIKVVQVRDMIELRWELTKLLGEYI